MSISSYSSRKFKRSRCRCRGRRSTDEIFAALVDDAAARQVQVDLVEHHADAGEQLDRPDRQRADDARRQALHVGRAAHRRRDGTARLAEVDVVGLHREEAVEVPAGEDLHRVVAIAEVDADVVDVIEAVDLVDGRREVADAGAEIEPLEVSPARSSSSCASAGPAVRASSAAATVIALFMSHLLVVSERTKKASSVPLGGRLLGNFLRAGGFAGKPGRCVARGLHHGRGCRRAAFSNRTHKLRTG